MGKLTRWERCWFWSILGLAFAIRCGAAWFWQEQVERAGVDFRFGDSQSYWVIASNIANHGVYQYGSEHAKIFRAPLYPILLAPWAWIGSGAPNGSVTWGVRCMGCLLGVGAVACVMWMTLWIANANTALFAGLLASVYPGAIGMSIFILSEAISTPLFLLSCGMMLGGLRCRNHRPTFFLAAGVAFGLSCLARPSWSLWPAVAIPYCYLATKPSTCVSGRVAILSLAAFCLGAVAVMAPWWVRNYQVTGKWVPTTLQVGASLYDGWHPGASGSSDENMDFVIPFLIAQNLEDETLAKQGQPLESTREWRVDRRMRQAALAWAWENPSDVIRLSLVKFTKMWSPLPVAREVPWWIRGAEGFAYVALVLGAWVGAWQWRRERGAWLAWMPCLYLGLLHTVFIGSVRYRQPAVMLLCPLAAVGWWLIIEWIRKSGCQAVQRENGSS
jgi:4-amino-4-deoxy-L-arabinose transferase-like glycosyltransferase